MKSNFRWPLGSKDVPWVAQLHFINKPPKWTLTCLFETTKNVSGGN